MKTLNKSIILSVTNDLVHDQRMIRTCNSLHAAGYNVILVGRRKKDSAPLTERAWQQERMNCLFVRGPLFYAEFNIRLFFRLLSARADIFVAADLDTIVATWMVARLRGRKMVYDAHEFFTEVPELSGRSLVKSIWETVGRMCVPRADLCYTVSGSLSRALEEKYHREFHVILNVPMRQPVTPAAAQNIVPVLFYQGALNPGRGLEECIKALHGNDAELRIAGDGPLMGKLVKLIEEEGLSDRVRFLGWLNARELAAETSSATIGLNILDSNSLSYRYSLANKFFNYIHAGIPQICADMPEYRAINEKWEVAVLCSNTRGDIEAAVKSLTANRDYCNKLSLNCREAAMHLNWQLEEKKLIELYHGL